MYIVNYIKSFSFHMYIYIIHCVHCTLYVVQSTYILKQKKKRKEVLQIKELV